MLQEYDTSGILSNVTSKNLEKIRQLLEEKEKENKRLKEERENQAKLQKLKEKENKQLKEDKVKLQSNLEKKEQKIAQMKLINDAKDSELYFFQSTIPTDKQALEDFLHSIKTESSTIKNDVQTLTKKISKISSIDSEHIDNLLGIIDRINEANQRIHAIASYATKANFKGNIETVKQDIRLFTQEYLINIWTEFNDGIEIHINYSPLYNYTITFKPIEVAIILENLLSNSRKAKAKNVWVDFTQIENNQIQMKFQDDGNGLAKNVPSIDYVFRRGFTTTFGSGLGLHFVKNLVEQMEGTINAIETEKGLCFVFKFKL